MKSLYLLTLQRYFWSFSDNRKQHQVWIRVTNMLRKIRASNQSRTFRKSSHSFPVPSKNWSMRKLSAVLPWEAYPATAWSTVTSNSFHAQKNSSWLPNSSQFGFALESWFKELQRSRHRALKFMTFVLTIAIEEKATKAMDSKLPMKKLWSMFSKDHTAERMI